MRKLSLKFYCDVVYSGVFYGSFINGGTQLALQLYAVVITIAWSAICTSAILLLLGWTIGVRVSLEAEDLGLDNSLHRSSLSLNNSIHSINHNNNDLAATIRQIHIELPRRDNRIRIPDFIREEGTEFGSEDGD